MNGGIEEFTGKIAVITGGASGIGRGIAEALLEAGAVVVLADIEQGALDAAVDELSQTYAGASVEGMVCDVSVDTDVAALADRVFTTHGSCHLLFANAAVSCGSGPLWEHRTDDLRWMFDVNVLGVAHMFNAFVPKMLDQADRSWVVTTSSGDGGIAPAPNHALYSGTKAMATVLTESLAAQLAAREANIGVSIVIPSGGVIPTNMMSSGRNRQARYGENGETPRFPDFETFISYLRESGGNDVRIMEPKDLGRFVLDGVRQGLFTISHERDVISDLLHERADVYTTGALPPNIGNGLSARRQGAS